MSAPVVWPIAVLASGGGSNLAALLRHLDRLGPTAPARVGIVISDRAGAGALERARNAGVPWSVVSRGDHAALESILVEHATELVVLAGYLALVPPSITRRYRGRIINIHPSLLPDFGGRGMYGERVHQAVLAAGVPESGCTVHFVTDEYDRGPIAAQWRVPVLPDDTAHALAERVLRAEHELLPRVVVRMATGQLALEPNGEVRGGFSGASDADTAMTEDALAAAIDARISMHSLS